MTTDDIIEQMVTVHYGKSDARTQHYFRQELQVLVAMAKSEQLRECGAELSADARVVGRMVH